MSGRLQDRIRTLLPDPAGLRGSAYRKGEDMDKEWSEKNKQIQKDLAKEKTFTKAIDELIAFRNEMFLQISQIVSNYPEEAFSKMPYAKADGYHSKSLAYSIWHIFRIEDIVAHEMIANDEQVFFRENYQERIRSPLITTGNELSGEAIVDFSADLSIRELYEYAKEVKSVSDNILKKLEYADLKRTFNEETYKKLESSGCISDDENAGWLMEYWCSKDIEGLIRMPFSRHWIMHIEAMRRIKNRLCELARKGVDPIAYCGLSCAHCFLGKWCGGCRTDYNACSNATCSPDHVCPNVACCKEKGIDGCYECEQLKNCSKGFYAPANDGTNAAKAQSLYIGKYGKKALLKVQDRLHEKYEFKKIQEILGQNCIEGLKILEEN